MAASITNESAAPSLEKSARDSVQEPRRHMDADGADESRTSPQDEWKIARHELLIILSLTVINMVVALDASIIVTALSAITVDLDADTTQSFWIGTAYLLASTIIELPIASISEIFGRPICLMFSLTMFSVGSILCCVARGIGVMLAGRTAQGIGGGAVWVLSTLLLTDIVPLRHRPRWWSVISLGWAIGLVIGPLIGGAIVGNTTWRWIFYLNFPFCAFGLVVVPTLLTLQPREGTIRRKLARVDWIGGLLFTGSLTIFLYALSAAGIRYAWRSVHTLVPLIVGVIGLLATWYWENSIPSEPILKSSILYNWSSRIAYFGGFIQGLVMYGLMYYMPFFFLAVKQASSVQAGVYLLPCLVVVVPSGAVGGILISRLNDYRYTILTGWLLTTLSTGLLMLWSDQVLIAIWIVTLVIQGIGQGLLLNAQSFACQAIARPGEMAAAAAMYGFVRQFGASVGVSVGSATFQNMMALKLGREGLPQDIAYHAQAYMLSIDQLPQDNKTKVLTAYVFGFSGIWAVFLGIQAVVLLLSFLIKRYDLNKGLESEHTLQVNRVSRLLREQRKDPA